jgi:hypothetical protein
MMVVLDKISYVCILVCGLTTCIDYFFSEEKQKSLNSWIKNKISMHPILNKEHGLSENLMAAFMLTGTIATTTYYVYKTGINPNNVLRSDILYGWPITRIALGVVIGIILFLIILGSSYYIFGMMFLALCLLVEGFLYFMINTPKGILKGFTFPLLIFSLLYTFITKIYTWN